MTQWVKKLSVQIPYPKLDLQNPREDDQRDLTLQSYPLPCKHHFAMHHTHMQTHTYTVIRDTYLWWDQPPFP